MKLHRQILTLVVMMIGLSSPAMAHHQPYAGLQARSIKALSDQQLADLRAGRGMGLALTAELNGYPGPTHVLELSKELDLSQSQREQIESLFAAMKAETIPTVLLNKSDELGHKYGTIFLCGVRFRGHAETRMG